MWTLDPARPRPREYQLVYCALLNAARRQSRVFYAEVAEILESFASDPEATPEVGDVLSQIAEDEHRAGRPLLSALAVTGKSIPGEAFFASARHLGVLSSRDPAEEMRFWMEEQSRVYDTWTPSPAEP